MRVDAWVVECPCGSRVVLQNAPAWWSWECGGRCARCAWVVPVRVRWGRLGALLGAWGLVVFVLVLEVLR